MKKGGQLRLTADKRLRSAPPNAFGNFFYPQSDVQNCSAILNIGRRDITLDVLVAEQLRTSSGWLNVLPRANSRRALRQPDAR